jgi:hypothetical protein
MTFGYEVMRPNGSIMTNGLSKGGVLLDVLVCPAGSSGTAYYPSTRSANLSIYTARAGAHTISGGDKVGPNGDINGTISWAWSISGWQQDTVLYVFGKKIDTLDLFGLQLTNDNGDVLADPLYPAPQFAGTVQLGANATLSYMTPDGYTASVHSVTVNLRPGADKLILMNLPDSGTGDTWYQLRREYILASEGSVLVEVVVYTKAASYQLPSLHVYAVNNPVSSGALFTLQALTPSQQVTYDASIEGLSTVGELQMSYTGYGYTTSYSLPAGYTLGMSVPFYREQATTVNGALYVESVYIGVGKRVGTQLTLGVLLDDRKSVSSSSKPTYVAGGSLGRYTMLADVSQLSPSNITGIPAPISSAPVFTTQPNSKGVHPGDAVSFSVAVSGYPTPALQWYQNGVAISGATGTSISFSATLSNDGTSYYCVASNAMGTVQSTTAYLYVNNVEAVHITSSNGPAGGYVGDSATFSMTATGTPTPYCTITGPGISASGYGSCSTTVTLASYMNGGNIVFHAENTDGSFHTVEEVNRTLTVSSPTPAYPVFSVNPTSQSVVQNGSAVFSAAASPADSYQWYRNGTGVGSGSSHSADTSVVGSFIYVCRAWNGTSYTDSSSATLTVTAPAASTYPSYNSYGLYDDIGAGTLSWGASDKYTDSGPWANGTGDASLYDIRATSSTGGTVAPSGSSYGVWYSLAGGASWSVTSTTGTNRTIAFNWSIRLRSSGAIVSTGSVHLTAGIQ